MPLDPLAKRFLTMMAAGSPSDRLRPSLNDRRQAFAKLMRRFVRADMTAATGTDGALPGPAGDIPYRLYAPANEGSEHLPGFVFFHGGGMVGGSIDTHDGVCAALAQTTGCRLVSVGYRLAPEHKFPSGPEDCYAVTKWVAENATAIGCDAKRIAVGGTSAGGNCVVRESTASSGCFASATMAWKLVFPS